MQIVCDLSQTGIGSIPYVNQGVEITSDKGSVQYLLTTEQIHVYFPAETIVTAGFTVQNKKSQIVLNTSINSRSCVPFSILPMIYQYFWRARLAKKMSQNEEIKNMSELKPRITENEIDYILVGDYYIPDLKLPEEHRPIGKYGRMHREYLREVHPARQAQERLDTIMEQMKAAEGVTEELKRTCQMEWVQRCNNIHNRAEEIILHEMIYS